MMHLMEGEALILSAIRDIGGSWCPAAELAPASEQALRRLVKAKRLTVEVTDGGNRYHLTAQGRADAS